jgi:hypothetical protein
MNNFHNLLHHFSSSRKARRKKHEHSTKKKKASPTPPAHSTTCHTKKEVHSTKKKRKKYNTTSSVPRATQRKKYNTTSSRRVRRGTKKSEVKRKCWSDTYCASSDTGVGERKLRAKYGSGPQLPSLLHQGLHNQSLYIYFLADAAAQEHSFWRGYHL